MSVLQVYVNWVNSVLSDSGRQLSGIGDIQQGEVICHLIDTLYPRADLYHRASTLKDRTSVTYLEQAVNFLKDNGVKINFTSDDIYHGDIKSILDLLWVIILNFSIHKKERSAQKRTIRNGKKLILRWCQKQLPDGTWDLKQSVVNNLCLEDNFSLLLRKFAGGDQNTSQDKTSCLSELLQGIESKYKIKKEIIRADDVVDGTVDEHNLLIYLSLLRQRVGVSYGSDESSEESLLSESSFNLTVNNSRIPSEFEKNFADQNSPAKYRSSPRFGRSPSPSGEPLSAILKSFAQGDSPTSREKLTDTPARKAVSFSPRSGNMVDVQSRSPLSTAEERKSRMNGMAGTHSGSRRESPSPIRNRNGRFSSGYSPSRYAKSFEIPPEKKKELENRTRAMNSNHSLYNSPSHPTSDTNGFSEDTSDWFSSDLESQGTVQGSPAYKRPVSDGDSSRNVCKLSDTINRKVTEILPESESTETDQSMDENMRRGRNSDFKSVTQSSWTSANPSTQSLYPATNIPGLQGPNHPSSGNNFRIPVGGVPMFGVGAGSSAVSRYGGVPLFLLPGHSPEVTQLLEALQRQQKVEHRPADMTDGGISVGDDSRNESRFETSEQISEDGHGEYSNMTGGSSSFFDSPRKRDRSYDVNDSETELKPITNDFNSSTSNSPPISSAQRNERLADKGIPSMPHSLQGLDKAVDPIEDDALKKIRHLREALQNPNQRLQSEIGSNGDNPYRRDSHNDELSSKCDKNGEGLRDDRVITGGRQAEPFSSSSHVKSPLRHENLNDRGERELGRQTDFINSSSPSRYSNRQARSQEQDDLVATDQRDSGNDRSSTRYLIGERSQEQDDLLAKDVVQMLTNELKDLKSKVDTLERSQGDVECENVEQLRREQLFERSGRSPQRSPQRSRTHSPHRSPIRSPHRSPTRSPQRSLLRPSEESGLNVYEASKRARDNVEDLVLTMQTPLSRGKPPNNPYPRKSQENKVEPVTQGREHARRDLSSRPLLAFNNFRSHSEDRFDRRMSRPRHSSENREEWKSQSFHGDVERKDEWADEYYRNRSKSLEDLTGNRILTSVLSEDELIVKPPPAASISYGYSSPVHKISADIWGIDMKDLDNLEPGRQKKWKKMTEAKKFMTDIEIIELKQCLASATMENEILRAKLNNASHEIGEKLTRVAAVLEETKLSLIKTQAENEELKTSLEKEREKAVTAEVRARESEAALHKAKFENDRLDVELREANFLLQGMDKEGVHKLEQENEILRRKLNMAASEEKKVLEELGRAKEIRDRSLAAVKDLRYSLDDTRDQNEQLQDELDVVKTQEKSYRRTATLLSRAKDINENAKKRNLLEATATNVHSEKGQGQPGPHRIDAEERRDKYSHHSSSPAVSNRTYATSTPYSRLKSAEPLMTSSPTSGRYNVQTAASPSGVSPVVKSSGVPRSYNYEEISPAVSLSRREIYPHRRPKSAVTRGKDSSLTGEGINDRFEAARRKWSVAGPLNFSDYDLSESLTERPLRDRESEENLTPAKPPRPTSASRSDYRSSLPRGPARDGVQTYSNKYEPRSNLTRSYRSEEDLSRVPAHHSFEHNSSLQHLSSDFDYAYHPRLHSPTRDRKPNHSTPASSSRLATGYDQEVHVKTPLHGGRDDITPRRYYGYSGSRSPSRGNAPVRGILKPSSSEQDLRRASRYSPPHRHVTSPNVTFNTEVESRDISPQSRQIRQNAESAMAGVPLFSGPTRRYGVVRNLNYDFEDEEPVRDIPRQSAQGFRAKSWLESKNSTEIPVLTSEQRDYVDHIIDKYVSRRQGYDDSSFQST